MTDEDKKQAEENKHAHGHEHAETEKTAPAASEIKTEEKKAEKTEKKHVHEKPKKTEAKVNAKDIPISTKHSAAICRFIRKKGIPQAINELREVAKIKRPVPMRGEIPHRRGKGMMSGRFPQKAAKEFIILLKSLEANANYAGIENPVISEAKANIGARPFGRRGIRRKRTHITLTAKAAGEKNEK